MHVRLLTHKDLPVVADITANALLDDELIEYLCPDRRNNYLAYRRGFARKLKQRLSTPGVVSLVAVTDPDDDSGDPEGGKVVGYIAWERVGNGPDARRWRSMNEGFWNRLEKILLAAEMYYLSHSNFEMGVDQSRLASYQAGTSDNFPCHIFPEMWYLELLQVDPACQGRGVGKMLTQWGIEQARSENVPVGLEASARGTGMYLKLGFGVLKDVQGAPGTKVPVMIWEPPGLGSANSWYERARKEIVQESAS